MPWPGVGPGALESVISLGFGPDRPVTGWLDVCHFRIAVARQDYNAAVEQFNAMIRRFPTNLTAKMFGLGTKREYFQATEGAETPPEVKF